MHFNKAKDTSYYTFGNLSGLNAIKHFVSTREDGDMSFKDTREMELRNNLTKFLGIFEIQLKQCVFGQQIHSDNVSIINEKTAKEEVYPDINWVKETDSLITNETNVCLVIKTADCIPCLLYDPKKNVIAAAHSGWKGSLVHIIGKTVERMKTDFNSHPGDLIVGMGPSIGPTDCFVRSDVQSLFLKEGYGEYLKFVSVDQWLLDLWKLNVDNLVKTGVKKENIELSNVSTYSSDDFFSYRKKDPKGHFITGIMIN
jgi:polyphenol oxidase